MLRLSNGVSEVCLKFVEESFNDVLVTVYKKRRRKYIYSSPYMSKKSTDTSQ